MSTKYPNANTSPERLIEIAKHFDDQGPRPPRSYLRGYNNWKRGVIEQNDPIAFAYDLLAMLEERTRSEQFYYDQYARAVKASTDVFQVGGPLSYLLTLGQCTLLDGPKAAADEIARLKAYIESMAR